MNATPAELEIKRGELERALNQVTSDAEAAVQG